MARKDLLYNGIIFIEINFLHACVIMYEGALTVVIEVTMYRCLLF